MSWVQPNTTSEVIPSPTVTSTKRALPLLTESRLKTFRRCAREHFYRYILGFAPTVDAVALRFGTLVHLALAIWWARNPYSDRLDVALEALADHSDGVDVFDLVKAEEMIRGYDARWGDETYLTIAVESEFRAPLVNPTTGQPSRSYQLAGKLDVLAQHGSRKVIVEHKTASGPIDPGSVYWERLPLDGQVSTYFRGAEALGHGVEACVYDVLGKVALRPHKATPLDVRKYKKTGELYANQRDTDEPPEEFRARVREEIAGNPDRYYQRGEVVRLEEEMKRHDLETWHQAGVMRDMQRLDIAPMNTDACLRFNQKCSYFDVCSRTASLDDTSRFRKLDSVHEELSTAKEEPTK